jgi:hypothetical protein
MTGIMNIQSHNERVFVTDMADSLHVFKFKNKVISNIKGLYFF